MNLFVSIQSVVQGQQHSFNWAIASSLTIGLVLMLRRKKSGWLRNLKRKIILYKMLKKSHRFSDRKGLMGLISVILLIGALILLVTGTGTLGLALGLGIASLVFFGLYSYY